MILPATGHVELPPHLGECLATRRRQVAHGAAQFGHQLLERGGLALQLHDRVVAAPDLRIHRFQGLAALVTRGIHRRELLAALGLQRGQALAFRRLGGRGLVQPRDQVLDFRDFAGARAAEIRVVDQHAPERRRILLRQQQLELFHATADIGRAQFRRQHVALLAQGRLARLAIRGDAVEARVTLDDAPADIAELAAGVPDIFLRIAQLAVEGVAPVGVATHRALQRFDALAHFAQLFLGRTLGRGGTREGERKAGQEGRRNPTIQLKFLIYQRFSL